MYRPQLIWVLVLGVCLGWNIRPATAQSPEDVSRKIAGDLDRDQAAYRLDFSLHELEDGKKINSRQYSLNLLQGVQWQDLKIGTRVPVEMKQGEVQYLDVGTKISARLQEIKSALELDVVAELSNFTSADQEQKSRMPLLRQLRISGATIVTSGKPMLIGSVDDPTSKRQFQLEATVTRLK